jgi:hypothetical protein
LLHDGRIRNARRQPRQNQWPDRVNFCFGQRLNALIPIQKHRKPFDGVVAIQNKLRSRDSNVRQNGAIEDIAKVNQTRDTATPVVIYRYKDIMIVQIVVYRLLRQGFQK